MVVYRDLEVQLVDANTKVPFQEHPKGHDTYVEVEPNVDYFIRLRRVWSPSSWQSGLNPDNTSPLVCTLHVDNQNLNYQTNVCGNVPSYHGLWSCMNGVSTQTALRFAKPKEDGMFGDRSGYFGKVQVRVYESVYQGVSLRDKMSFSTTLEMKNVARVDDDKTLRSTEGETFIAAPDMCSIYPNFAPVRHLYTITLIYCTTKGLIKAGILCPPPTNETKRIRYNIPDVPLSKCPKPTKIKRTCPGCPDEEIDLYDLTAYDSD